MDFGTLKIKTFYTLARDEHGRETAGKWINIITKHGITKEDAEEIFTQAKKCNPEDQHLYADFVVRETFY